MIGRQCNITGRYNDEKHKRGRNAIFEEAFWMRPSAEKLQVERDIQGLLMFYLVKKMRGFANRMPMP